MKDHYTWQDLCEIAVALLAMLLITAALVLHFVPDPQLWWQVNP